MAKYGIHCNVRLWHSLCGCDCYLRIVREPRHIAISLNLHDVCSWRLVLPYFNQPHIVLMYEVVDGELEHSRRH